MTIKDIAKAANVSAATVSRIINHKDDNISQETRDRVLRIIAENDYVPYAKIRSQILSQTNSIGLMIPTLKSTFYVRFASCIQQLASANNYSLVLSLSGDSPETEQKALKDFLRNHTDGVICFPGNDSSIETLRELHEQGMAVVTVDHFARPVPFPQICRDTAGIAQRCTQLLLDSNALQVSLVLRADCTGIQRESLICGYTAALAAAGLPVVQDFITVSDENFQENFRIMADAGLNGVVCENADIARMVYATAVTDGLQIPEDLSVISMEDDSNAASLYPALTAAAMDVMQIADTAFDCLLSQVRHNPLPFTSLMLENTVCMRSSIRQRHNPKPKILVAGYINTDILLGTPDLPQIGKTQVASHIADYVGGKGANQAYGIGMLGGNVYLLGRLGSDRRGRFIREHLMHAGVKLDGVSYHDSLPTGTAYISLYPGGKSSVLIDPGANAALDPAYIRQNKALLKDANYCLIQTDIPMESVAELRQLCRQYSVPVVLNCSYGVLLPEELLKDLHILIMKDQERQKLYPQFRDQEECAQWLRSRGVKNVIFTSGVSGCFWSGEEGTKQVPNYAYPSIDDTGTGDVLTGCLVTLLAEKIPFSSAIAAASWAAAYSATKLGVQSGFPDRSLLLDIAAGNLQIQFQK